jgi:hypothetical protein
MKKPQHTTAFFIFDDNPSQMLNDALAFLTAISTPPGNTWVTIAAAAIAATKTKITTAQAAETNTKTRTIGAAKARDLAVSPVVTDVLNYVAIVQTAVNNAPNEATALTIITECGLHYKEPVIINKNDFKSENDAATSGVVDIVFKAAPRGVHACYELQESIDGINFTPAKVSPDSRYKYAHGKAIGTKLWFRGRISLSEKRGGAQTWLYPVDVFLYTK